MALVSVPLLVALNGFFVATEFALVAVRKTRVEAMVRQRVSGAAALGGAVRHLDRSIAATQLGITLASIGLGWVGEPALERLIHPLFGSLPAGWQGAVTQSAAWATAFLLVTFLHVVFGELVPKTVALQTTDRTALWVAGPLVWFARLMRPLIALMNGTGNLLLRSAGYRPADGREATHSVEELALIVEETEEAGVLGREQAEVVQNAFRLSGKRVRDCMVPREQMAALELHSQPEQALEAVRRGAHTRMPVFDGDPDNVVGIVNTKDLFYLFSLRGVVILEDALYPPLFLKPAETVGTALRLFRRARRPMALVRDEGGRILGLLTLEDVLEEIVGEIEDEHDGPANGRAQRRERPRNQRSTAAPQARVAAEGARR
jgi:CBS domain containing-hemolysin-like protein